jgi:site-specific DNA-methyltransferase (adenine-specific)/adenine-specific DNA-methyltransferase
MEIRQSTMRLKPNILSVATTATLRQIAEHFELLVNDKRNRQELIDVISSGRRCQPEELLGYLGEREIKQVCVAAGVDSRGRRNGLVNRLLRAGSPTPGPAPTLRSPSIVAAKTFNHSQKRTTMSYQQPSQAPLPLAVADGEITSVEKYAFAPIKGYPMLNWRGKRPFTSTQYFPAQLKELHGEEVDSWRNKIFWGDNLQVMSHLLKTFRGKVDLIYIDPPFDSKADYKKKIALRGKEIASEQSTFEEKQYTDIWSNDDYLQFMYERLILLRELLAETGSIYIHCDYHQNHYLRCVLDEVFGRENFLNEIVWKRAETVKGNSGQGSKYFGENTDTIYFYRRGGDHHFTSQFKPYTQEYIEAFYKYFEPKTNRQYRLISMTAPGGDGKGNPFYEVLGVSRHWRYSKERMNDLITKGLVVQTKPGNVPQRKLYLDEGQGVPLQNLWDDISGLAAVDGERTGYPTQKPEALVERIINASSLPGNLVLDCFMGSGTTQAVAMKLGRRFIGADINLGAIQATTKRLASVAEELRQAPIEFDSKVRCYTGMEVYNVNNYDLFRNPVQAKDLLLEALEVQTLELSSVFDGEKDGRMVKIMPVNRVATRADLNELIAGFNYKAWERRQADNPNHAVEKITLVCMGHEPDLRAQLELAAKPFKVDVEVVDILRDKADLEFKRDSEAKVVVKKGKLVVERFFPMNLLQKLSLQKNAVEDWRGLVDSIFIDWNYDGAVLQPAVVDIPCKNDVVEGAYAVPPDAGTIRVKITDLLSETWEGSVSNG